LSRTHVTKFNDPAYDAPKATAMTMPTASSIQNGITINGVSCNTLPVCASAAMVTVVTSVGHSTVARTQSHLRTHHSS
jgi:hypothetical protein